MTNQQIKFLRYLYKKPRSVTWIYKKMNINYDSFLNLTCGKEMQDAHEFNRNDKKYEESMICINNTGRAIVENFHNEHIRKVCEIIVAAMAFAAFIKSFFFSA